MSTNLNILTRSCGECTACCTACAVAELQKPLNTPCQHICEKGCGIYETRPQSCRNYHCIWLQGGLPEKFRPDKSGFVFSMPAQPRKDQVTIECTTLRQDYNLQQLLYLFDKIRANFKVPAHLIIYPSTFHKPFGPGYATIGKRISPNVQIAVAVTAAPGSG